jgi:hypothetical protein
MTRNDSSKTKGLGNAKLLRLSLTSFSFSFLLASFVCELMTIHLLLGLLVPPIG